MALETENIDKLYLELSQFTTAKTGKEIKLEKENRDLKEKISAWRKVLHVSFFKLTPKGQDQMIDEMDEACRDK